MYLNKFKINAMKDEDIFSFMKSVLYSSNNGYIKYLNESWKITRKFHDSKIDYFAPNILEYKMDKFKIKTNNIFQSISITGKKCYLMCDHCKGKLLESMHHVNNSTELKNLGSKLTKDGCKGVLISGGSSKDGTLPFDRFIDAIEFLHNDLNLRIAVHTGLIDLKTSMELKKAGVESAMIDIIGSEETIKQVYHLNKKPEDFEKALENLVKSRIHVSPHIVVGLHFGKIYGELNSIRIISKYKVKNIVIVAFKPLNNNAYTDRIESPLEIGKIISIVRILNPDRKILLGCARPSGFHKIKTEILSIKSGVNGIAFPTPEALKFSDYLKLKKQFSPYCCSFIDL
jgi:uncharacterized radical SAM superfamily protein